MNSPTTLLHQQLDGLKLPFLKAQYAELAQQAAQQSWTHVAYLEPSRRGSGRVLGAARQGFVQAHDFFAIAFACERRIERHQSGAAVDLRARMHDVSLALSAASPALTNKPDRVISDITWCDLFAPSLTAYKQGRCCGSGILYQLL